MSDFLQLTTHTMHYRVDGPSNAPTILFSNSLGTNLHMWDEQIASLSEEFQIVRYDRRGHGESSVSAHAFEVEDLGQDVLALMDHLRLEKVHFCGLSIGGLVGQWLGIHASERLHSLTICASASKIGTAPAWNERATLVREQGLSPLLEGTKERWFNPEFITHQPQRVEAILHDFLNTSAEGYAHCCEALAKADFSSDLSKITVPTFCVYGQEDPVCPSSDLIRLAQAVPHGSHAGIAGRHIFNIESPDTFNKELKRALAR